MHAFLMLPPASKGSQFSLYLNTSDILFSTYATTAFSASAST